MGEEDDFEQSFRRSEGRRRIVRPLLWLVLAALGISPCVMLAKNIRDRTAEQEARDEASKMRPDELARIGPLAVRAEQRVSARRATWAKLVTRESLASVSPGEGRCGHSLKAPTEAAAKSYVMHRSIDLNYFGTWSFQLIPASAPEIASRTLQGAASVIDRAKKAEAERKGERDVLTDLTAIAEDRYFSERYDIFVMVEAQKEAIVLSDTYLSGLLVGRVYLYSHGVEGLSCAGDIKVESSDKIDFNYFKTNPVFEGQDRAAAAAEALKRDMEVQTRRSIAAGLRARRSAAP